LENCELVTKREDLRLQGGSGSKTGGYQSEKGDEKRAHRGTTRISRMIGTSAFSDRTEFSVTTGLPGVLVLSGRGRLLSNPIKMIPREDRPDFRSMAKATWLDLNNVHRTRYVIQPMKSGVGFAVINTYNDSNSPVRENFEAAEGAQEFLRITPAR